MRSIPLRRLGVFSLAVGVSTALAACGPANSGSPTATDSDQSAGAGEDQSATLSGQIAGAGASSQENAALAWMAGFTESTGVTVTYDAVGSGSGREQFLEGTVQFAGSDSAFSEEEKTLAVDRCFGNEALELPLYISPIAVVYNLDIDTEHLNLSGEMIAKIFAGEITKWNDQEIAAANPGVELPDLEIIPVNRSDKSGTTGNFTDYLSAVAPDAWTYGKVEEWPISGTQSGQQTSGMIDVVKSAQGTIGYADASRAEGLGTVAVGVGDDFVPYSAEAAAKVVDSSPMTEDATDLRLSVDLARDVEGSYPIVLVSYMLACSGYDDPSDAANVAAFLDYVASEEGQQRAADPGVAGSAPISPDLRERVTSAISSIEATG